MISEDALTRLLAQALLSADGAQAFCEATRGQLAPFADPQQNLILAAVHLLHRRGAPVDVVTLTEALDGHGVGLDALNALARSPLLAPLPTQAGRLVRPFDGTDADAFVDAVRESVDTVGAWMPWCRADYSVLDAVAWFDRCRAQRAAGDAFDLGIFDADGSLLGGVSINRIDAQHRVGNLGYWVRQSRQRQGVARDAAACAAHFGFTQLWLKRLEIVVAEDNHASRAVALALGAVFECVAPQRLRVGEQSRAAAVYSLVAPPGRA